VPGIFLDVKAAGNLTAICETIVQRKYESLDV
jgi:hypothetical protein